MKNLLKVTPLLEQCGLKVSAADDTQEALEVIEEEAPIALVLVNTMMPDNNGYDTIKSLNAQFPEMVIIAMSAASEEKSRETLVPSGAKDFLELPIITESLEALLNRHLPAATPKSER